LTRRGMEYIINIKPVGNASLFEEMHRLFERGEVTESEETLDDGTRRGYRFAADFALNNSHAESRVNMLEYWIVDKKGKTTNFSWITNLSITIENVHAIAQAGRTRWSIENELFNTLKNQGYEFEHNYGHGKQYLSSTLAGLTLLAFLTDQLQNHACQLFKAARLRTRVQKKMWANMRSIIELVDIPDWETLWKLIVKPGKQKAMLVFVDSG
jgi:DNA-binding winged helix-turn-helix (wHTH) protein